MALFERRFARSNAREGTDLVERAARLAVRHDLPKPTEIGWVSNQSQRWGSCTPSTGVIRISDRMVGFPTWVVDHVIVHEMAHLVEPGHGPAFKALAQRYRLAERAEGYLLAKSGGTDAESDPLDGDAPDGDKPGDSHEPGNSLS